MVRGVASDAFFSWPFTPFEITVPMRMPTVNVAKIVSVYAGRFAFRRAQKPLASGSIELPPVRSVLSRISALPIIPFHREREESGSDVGTLPKVLTVLEDTSQADLKTRAKVTCQPISVSI